MAGLPGYSDSVRSMFRDQGKSGGSKMTREQAESNRRAELLHRLQEGVSVGGGTGGSTDGKGSGKDFRHLALEKVMRLDALRPKITSGEGSDAIANFGAPAREEDEDDDDPYVTASPKKKDVLGGRSGGAMSEKMTQILRKGKMAKASEKPLEIVIPVTNERMKPAEIKKTLKTEYATRYCEHLGVTPTAQNINFVLRTLPLDKCKIRQVLHPGLGRGERRNHISIQPHAMQPQDPNKAKNGGAGSSQGFGAGVTLDGPGRRPVMEPVNLLGMAVDSSSKEMIMEREKAEADAGAKKAVHDVSLPNFDSYKKRHIYPYNLQERFEASEPVKQKQTAGKGSAEDNSALLVRDRPVPVPPSLGQTVTRTPQAPAGGTSPGAPGGPQGGQSSTAKKLNLHDQLMSRLSGGNMPNFDVPTAGGGGSPDDGVSAEQIAQLEHLIDQELDCDDIGVAESPDIEQPQKSAQSLNEQETLYAHLKSQLDPMVARELDHTFTDFERDDVHSLQQQFLHDFPFDKYYNKDNHHGGATHGGSPLIYSTHSKTGGDGKTQERLRQEAEVGRVKSLLSSDGVTDLLMELFKFLFASYVAPYTKEHTAAAQTASKDQLFVEFYGSLLDFYEANSTREQLAVDIPIAICMFRVVVEGQMASKWPNFFGGKSTVGREVLDRISLFVSSIVDPTGLGSHLSRIESTPQALRALHKKRLPKQLSVSKMTPLMQFIVGDSAVSSEAKLLLRDRQQVLKKPPELLEIESQLSPLVRPRLLDEIIARKLLPMITK